MARIYDDLIEIVLNDRITIPDQGKRNKCEAKIKSCEISVVRYTYRPQRMQNIITIVLMYDFTL